MKTNADYTIEYRGYGTITVPKGTLVTHRTAMGFDQNYHFVDSFTWISENYNSIAWSLTHDVKYYGINIPSEFIDK